MLYDVLTGVGRTLLTRGYGPRYKLLILREMTIVAAGAGYLLVDQTWA